MKIKSIITTLLCCLTINIGLTTTVFAESKQKVEQSQNRIIAKEFKNSTVKQKFVEQQQSKYQFWHLKRTNNEPWFQEFEADGDEICVFQYNFHPKIKTMNYLVIDAPDCDKNIKFGAKKF